MYFLGEIKIYYMAKTKLLEYLGSPLTVLFHTQEFKRAVTRITTCCGSSGGEIFLDAGDNVTITGTGTELDPFVISSENGGLQSVVAGTNITIDNTDPLNPIISAASGLTGTGTNNVLTKWTGATSLGNSLVSEDATTVKIGAVGSQPTYAFGVYGTTNGATISAIDNALSLESGNTSTSPALIVSRSNTSANIAEFAAPSGVLVSLTSSGSVQSSALAGTGTRMVVADTNGLLSTQAIPGGGGSGWALTGNSIASGDKLGTTNAQDLVIIARNDTWATFGNPNQSIVLGTNTNGNATSRNVVIGHFAGGLSMTGTDNTAVGRLALYASTGIGNSAFGQGAGYTGTFVSGNYNTFLGFETQTSNAAITNSTAVGANVVLSQSNTVILGNNADIGVGTATPAASAKMEIVSTTKGFLPPRMTTTQKNAISTPATGLEVYDSTLNSLEFYDGTLWTGAWNRRGNIGASAANDFIGNRDNIDFNIRVNNFLVAKWSSNESVSIGSGSSASGQASIALGINSLNSGIAAIALGYQASVNGANNAIALGRLTQTNHEGAFTSQDYSGSNAFTSSVNHQWKTKFNGGYRFMIGTTVPADLVKIGVDAGKALEVISTTAMFIPPVMTGAQAEAISSKTEGGMIYSTDGSGVTITSKGWWGWNGTTWEKLNP